jgi:uncharacterized lipoprotein YddW (UPF0748 family)
MKTKLLALILLCLLATLSNAQDRPAVEREFRAAWIATVDNVDFPSKKTLSVEDQKKEILRDLEIAKELKMNAVVFQVRPMCDALYRSDIEPWSEFLTGEMGKGQAFDPLEFIVAEAHKRGILVHAWFNPYRAYHPAAKTVSENHISKRRPDLVKKYGKYLWLDPGEKEVQDYSLSVVLDVVRRYDIDGVHFDDYFYPYPEQADGKKIDFPDEISWEKYLRTRETKDFNKGRNFGKLTRDDWRRKNVDDFIAAVGRGIKKIKPEVMYGISPFGIWQPVPEKNIRGLNAYTELYADARKWLQEGTIDYLAPQLYWETAKNGQSYPVLLGWWDAQNTMARHIWPGLATYRIGSTPTYTAGEIVDEIKRTRARGPSAGTVHFSFKWLRSDLGGIRDALRKNAYQKDALIPPSPWKSAKLPRSPQVTIVQNKDYVRASWTERGARKAFWFVVYAKDKDGWTYSVLPSSEKSISLTAGRMIDKVIVTSVDRLGNESLLR